MEAEVDPGLDPRAGVHPLLGAVADIRLALGEAAAGGQWSLTDDQVVAALGQLLELRSSVEALTASLVGQAESRAVREQLGQLSTTGWLRRRFLLPLTEARRLTDLAAALPKWSRVRAALAQGPLGVQAAAAITTVLEGLPPTTSAVDLVRAEELLLTQGAFLDPAELAACGQHLREALTVTPDLDDPAEAETVAREAAAAAAAEASAWARRHLKVTHRRDGMVEINGQLPELDGALVREILEAAARPTDAVDGVSDERLKHQRMADALVEVVTTTGPLDLDRDEPGSAHPDMPSPGGTTQAPVSASASADHDSGSGLDLDAGLDLDTPVPRIADPNPNPNPPGPGRPCTARPPVTVSLIVNWRDLQARLAAAGTLPDGTTLSPAATLAALCDAEIIPMVFDSPGLPLHVGRSTRGFTPAIRRALAARDRGCTWVGCHRRASCCAAHHLDHWEHGGHTGIENGALLCRYHHQMLHREGWTGQLDAMGHPEYRPPAAIDPERRPRQHLRFATIASTPA